ncbi:MAG: antibiotic biosynthesis monooxygenase [Desulfobacteraceae bacterium]|nr:antibiotic biosynthesis monooxygenase [Desulfobacteraceae bacterium]
MLVKVFIKRQVTEENNAEFIGLLKKLRFKAMDQEGYISSETLVSTEDFKQVMVISTWQSLEDWNTWKESEERKNIDNQLEKLQTEPTAYEAYVFNKYRLSVKEGFPNFKG